MHDHAIEPVSLPLKRHRQADFTKLLATRISITQKFWWKSLWPKLQALWRTSRPQRQLRLRETLALGEKRFLAVVEYGGLRFLVGGTASALSLLAELPGDAVAVDARVTVSAEVS